MSLFIFSQSLIAFPSTGYNSSGYCKHTKHGYAYFINFLHFACILSARVNITSNLVACPNRYRRAAMPRLVMALKTKCGRISTVFQILPLSLLFIQNLVKSSVQHFSIGKIEN
jgi:hypothetical protein